MGEEIKKSRSDQQNGQAISGAVKRGDSWQPMTKLLQMCYLADG
jgi:hypothetical protein